MGTRYTYVTAPASCVTFAFDAPELGQKWAKESSESLRREVVWHRVRVVALRDEDPLPSDVYLGQVFLSQKRLRDGWAWNYVPYSTDKKLIAAEADAKAAKRGMWQDSNLQPPSEYRRQKASSTAWSEKQESELSWTSYLADCGLKAQESNEARTEKLFRERYKGKVVHWSGIVDSVKEQEFSKGYYVGVRMTPTESALGASDLTLSAVEQLQDKVLALEKGDNITFSGRLVAQGGRVVNHIVELDDLERTP
jgi:hypothetical protein